MSERCPRHADGRTGDLTRTGLRTGAITMPPQDNNDSSVRPQAIFPGKIENPDRKTTVCYFTSSHIMNFAIAWCCHSKLATVAKRRKHRAPARK